MNARSAARLRHAGVLLALCVASAQAQAPRDLRVALVIGNAAYPAAPLANPAHDARAIGQVLQSLGFDVIEADDADKAKMERALRQAADALHGGSGVGLLYYAGHGFQVDWHNYMVPLDAQLGSASDLESRSIDVEQVIDAFKAAGNRMNILVLDACRDNPFAGAVNAKGLAPMDAPPGTLLAYSTAPGNVAADGDASTQGNGLYTHFLLQEMKRPETTIESVFKKVRLQVRQQSHGEQIPWESTSLEEDFYFATDTQVRPTAQSQRLKDFETERADWERIQASSNPDDYYAFLQRYPDGEIAEKAQFQLDQLQKAAVVAQAGQHEPRQLAPGAARYRVGDEFDYRVFDITGRELPPHHLHVTQVDAQHVVINNGRDVWDLMGNVISDSAGVRSPARIWFPADLALGKRWRSASALTHPSGKTETVYWDFKVLGLEDVTVPAGSFRAYRVEGHSSQHTEQTETYWVDPTDFLMLKDEYVARLGDTVVDSHRRELVAAKRAE